MFLKRRVLRHILHSGIAIIAIAMVTAALITAVRVSEGFALRVYTPFSRTVSGWIGFLFSFTSFSAAEFILYTLTAALLLYFLLSLSASIRAHGGWPLLRWGFDLLLAAVIFVALFFALWGCNYFVPKLETRFPFRTGPQPEEVLFETAQWHLDQASLFAGQINRDETGAPDEGGFEALAPKAAEAVNALAARFPRLVKGAVSPPKRVVAYEALGYLGISGVYVPFTGECHVNTVSTEPFLPSTMCHELAHRLGFAPEEDANMIAYLACAESGDAIVRYSGELLAFNYCYSALSDPENRALLWARLPQTVRDDFAGSREAWERYEGPLQEVSASVNNTYLQAMSQPEGIKSYGRVVDMLIAYYLEKNL
ncbi:MAG: DUF3810 domain-containing protein [Oscillospiraceae bacterium]|jgi:hypothetical protein|nr:DUF3810 domain-containing protein [Oscillospiraceae bacterium]